MKPFRVALANLPFPKNPDESVALVEQALAQASSEGARLVCFPECFIPGYRGPGKTVPPPDGVFLERAWSAVVTAAKKAGVGAVVGTERVVEGGLLASALVVNEEGTFLGF